MPSLSPCIIISNAAGGLEAGTLFEGTALRVARWLYQPAGELCCFIDTHPLVESRAPIGVWLHAHVAAQPGLFRGREPH